MHLRPCRKIGQGHHRVVIYIHIVVLESSILHAKFYGDQSIGYGEEDFERFLPYVGMAAILAM